MPTKRPVKCFFNGVKPIPINREVLNRWIAAITDHYQASCKRLHVILCSDEELLLLNKQYLNHDTLTDIITFPYHEPGQPVDGELYISIERVRENAGSLQVDLQDELDRVIAHGMLHLIGFDDHSPEQQEEMRRQENYCLTLRG